MTTIDIIKKSIIESNMAVAEELILKLSEKELKALRPAIKELCKEWLDYRQVERSFYHNYERKASPVQAEILNFVAIFCLTKRVFMRYGNIFNFYHNASLSEKIIASQKVEWFNRCIAEENSFNYSDTLAFIDKGYLQANTERLASLLVNLVGNYNYKRKEGSRFIYTPERLKEHPDTLQKHIWSLFEYETHINHFDGGRYQAYSKEYPVWKNTLKQLDADGEIDRQRLLKECLLATNRNFNRVLSGWFFDTFLYLEPTNEELLALQPILFSILSSPHSKVVNGTLKVFKTLVKEATFLTEDFMDNTQSLLCSETKTIATSTLMIFDKLARQKEVDKTTLVNAAVVAFNSSHKAVHIRAAKFIAKHGETNNQQLADDIEMYSTELYAEAQELLVDFIRPLSQEEEVWERYEQPKVLVEENYISPVTTIDDFVFLASQAFDNNEAYHFDLLLQALIDIQPLLLDENIVQKLEPSFQRAYRVIFGDRQGKTTTIDTILATFYIDFGKRILLKRIKSAKLEGLHKKFKAQDELWTENYNWYQTKMISLDTFMFPSWNSSKYYKLFLKKARVAMKYLRAGQQVRLLSTPTHAPYWIAPQVLVKRIQENLKHNIPITQSDLCLAIARCCMEEQACQEALVYVREKMTGEYQQLLLYLLDKEAELPTINDLKEPYLQALSNKIGQGYVAAGIEQFGIIKDSAKYQGDIIIHPAVTPYESDRWDYTQQKNIKVMFKTKKLRVASAKVIGLNERLRHLFKGNPKFFTLPFVTIEGEYWYIEKEDAVRIQSLCPNNNNLLIYELLAKFYDQEDWVGGSSEGFMINYWTHLLEQPFYQQNPAFDILLACSLLCKSKVVRALAAEYWTQWVGTVDINHESIGLQLGKLQRVEFYPLKRLTDLIQSQMYKISQRHNRGLQIMLETMLAHMSDTPIRNTKKLLEILAELRAKSSTAALPLPTAQKLTTWSNTSSLKKLIGRLVD